MVKNPICVALKPGRRCKSIGMRRQNRLRSSGTESAGFATQDEKRQICDQGKLADLYVLVGIVVHPLDMNNI